MIKGYYYDKDINEYEIIENNPTATMIDAKELKETSIMYYYNCIRLLKEWNSV